MPREYSKCYLPAAPLAHPLRNTCWQILLAVGASAVLILLNGVPGSNVRVRPMRQLLCPTFNCTGQCVLLPVNIVQ